jgi:hypothetical protein
VTPDEPRAPNKLSIPTDSIAQHRTVQ